MRFAVTGIDHQPLEIWINDEPLQQRLPHTLVAPATKTPMGILPITIGRWKIAPGRPGSQNPKDAVNETSIVLSDTAPLTGLSRQMRLDQGPMSIGKIMASKGFRHRSGQWWPQWLPLYHIS